MSNQFIIQLSVAMLFRFEVTVEGYSGIQHSQQDFKCMLQSVSILRSLDELLIDKKIAFGYGNFLGLFFTQCVSTRLTYATCVVSAAMPS